MSLGTRIGSAIRAAKTSQVAVGKAFGISASAVNQWVADVTVPATDKLAELARLLAVNPYWLLTGHGPMRQEARAVPVVGRVGAGAEIFPIDDHAHGAGLEEAPAPPFDDEVYVAVQVVGDSMWPAYRPGDLIMYRRDGADDWRRFAGQEVVVKLRDGRTFVKLLKRVTTTSATLGSHNAPDIENVRIDWAAPVLWIRRSGTSH